MKPNIELMKHSIELSTRLNTQIYYPILSVHALKKLNRNFWIEFTISFIGAAICICVTLWG